MANAGGVDLCVGAIEGGALGSLPCGMLSTQQIREQVAEVRARAPGPLNLNFLCHRMPEDADQSRWLSLLQPYYDEFELTPPSAVPMRSPFDEDNCAAVEELRPEVVSFHFGLPDPPLLERVLATGAAVIATATSVEEGRWLEVRGVHAIIAQGFEAGGHSGRFLGSDPAEALGLFALIPRTVDAVDVPVIAAGAIGDGRGIAAALMLGASGVQLGTAYLQCPESLIGPEQREVLRERPTIVTNVYSGGLARACRGRLVNELGPIRSEAPPYPYAGATTLPLYRAALQRGEFDFLPCLGGQAGPLGRQLPAAELTRALTREALDHLARSAA